VARRAVAEATQQIAPQPARFTFGDLLRGARQAHPEFRHQDRLEQRLRWPHRKVLWLERNRIRPSKAELAQLTEVLPILRILLDRVQPSRREIETAGHV
jgi:hypothetical protein